MSKQYGLILQERRPEDYTFGQSLPMTVLQEDGDWTGFLPEKELQNKGYEVYACVSFTILNCVEMLIKRQYGETRNYSDRFLAAISGTKEPGNSPQVVAQFLRKIGVVLEDVYPHNVGTFKEYYQPIPREISDLADEFINEWDFRYEEVPATLDVMKQAIKCSPLGISVSAWYKNEKGFYFNPGITDNHLTTLFKIDDKKRIFDTYEDDGSPIKSAELDMPHAIVQRYMITRKSPDEQKLSWIESVIAKLWRQIASIFISIEEIKKETVVPKKDYITPFAEAIKLFEGYAAPGEADRTGKVWATGTPSWRRNNPGNIKDINESFIVYSNYETGFSALKYYIERACTDRHVAYTKEARRLGLKSAGDLSIRQYIHVYAPDGEVIETAYASYICNYMSKQLGETIFPSRTLKTLV